MIAKTIKRFLPIAMLIMTVVLLASCTVSSNREEAHEHNFDRKDMNSNYLKSEQTCDTAETYYYSCSCGQRGTETFTVGSPLGHSFSDTWSSDANSHWNPAICGHADQVQNKEKHTWDEGLVLSNPTEDAAGEVLYTCTVCHYTKRAQLPALSHTHTFDTAWSYDNTHHWHEATCGHNEISAPGEHAWNDGEITVEPTETKDGEMTYTCMVCSKTKTVTLPKKEHAHIFNQKVEEPKFLCSAATCEAKAKYYFSCVCGEKDTDTFEVGDLANHSYGAYISNNDATCGEDGTKSAICSVCQNKETIPDVGSKKAHTFADAWSTNDDYHWYPAICGHANEKKDYGEHNWDEGVVITPPTESSDGQKMLTCATCKKTKITSIPHLDHVHTFATEWTSDENYHWHAATCAHNDEKSAKAAHTFELTNEGYAPTVYEQGSNIYKCSVCDYMMEEIVDKLDSYTVIFLDANKGVLSEINYLVGTASVNIPAAPAKAGHRFVEWINTSSNTLVENYNFAGVGKNTTVTFTPVFKQEFTIMFADYNGDTLGTATVARGERLSADALPYIPERVGYTAKWADSVTEQSITSAMIITPVYEAIIFDVAFVDADGNLLYYIDQNDVAVKTQKVNYGSFAIVPEYPAYRFDPATLKLYEFTGWSCDIENITANHVGDNAIRPLYEREVSHPVIAVKISGTVAKISITLPDGAELYSLKLSFNWTNENGLCGIASAQLENISSLNKDSCGDTLCTVGDKDGDYGWLTYNNKNYTFDFLWACGNGHAVGAENVLTLTFESPAPTFVLDECLFEILESSSIVYGDADADITELQKADVFVWFY